MRERADRTRESFVVAFWDEAAGALADVIGPDGVADRSIRPNQLFAAALPFPPLNEVRARAMVECVSAHLLTPRGLRTLAPTEPGYQGRYQGDVHARDGAYHQGTVWPWLLGPYVDALLYAYGDSAAARARARECLLPLADHLDEACLGQVSEIFDGDPPHRPSGCPAQAWSVSELLRVWRRVNPPARAPQAKTKARKRGK